ncbi:hypothetical protein BBJ28_00011673 [Nothophytophthora sp. Chile5]|nr:hypothetical protein BBJ28_00011673 [Nothophytophthora sp. Chile5]
MWATSSRVSQTTCSESSRGLRIRRDEAAHRLSINGSFASTDTPWRVQLSDHEIATDLLATLPKLEAAMEDYATERSHWHRKSRSSDRVQVLELVPRIDGAGGDMDIVYAVLATTEIECHVNEVLNVLTSHKTSRDLEASMKALIPRRKVRHGEVLLQPRCTMLDDASIRPIRVGKPRFKPGGKTVSFASDHDTEGLAASEQALVSVNMTRFRSKRRIDLSGRLRNRHKRSQQLCLATLTQQFVDQQRAVHVIKTLPRKMHNQMAPLDEKHQQRSVLGTGLDHIAVGFDIQTRTVHCGGARGTTQMTRIVAHGYASVASPELFGEHNQKTLPSYSSTDVAHYRAMHVTAEAKHVIDLLTTSLRRFERVIRRRRLGLQSFVYFKPELRPSDLRALETCGVCLKRFSLLRREFFCQLCGHMSCADCSRLYEVEARVGEVRKNRICVRCIVNVDSCAFEDEDIVAALGPAVVAQEDESEDEWVSDSDAPLNTGSTVSCSDSDSATSSDELAARLCSEDATERSLALETLDHLVNSQIKLTGGGPLKPKQIRKDIENHLRRTLRGTECKLPGGEDSSFSIAPFERDYPLEFDGDRTMNPSHPIPPRPLPAKEQSRLQYIAQSEALSPAYDRSALNMLAQIAAAHLDCPIGYVSMIDEKTQHVVGLHPQGAIGTSMPRDEAMCAHTIYEDRPLVVQNALNDVRYSHMGFITQTGVKFYAGFPVRAPDGAVMATLCASDWKPHKHISAKQYAEMEALAALAGSLIIPG